MSKILLPLVALSALSFTTLSRPVEPLSPNRVTATLFPESTLVYVDGEGLADLFLEGADAPFVGRLLESPLGEALGGREALETQLANLDELAGTDVLFTLARASARGAGLGIAPKGAKPAWALVLHGDDADAIGAELQSALDRVGEQAGFPRAFVRPHDRVRGADVWYVGDELVIARRDALLLASNDKSYGRDVLDLAADADARGVTGREHFTLPRRENGMLAMWADLAAVRELAELGSRGGGLRKLAELPNNPQVHFLLGPSVAALGTAQHATAWLELDGNGLGFGVDGHGTDAMAQLRPRATSVLPVLPEPHANDVAVATLHRDLDAIYANRTELFPPEMQPALSKPISDLAVLFGGRDLTEDVLPGIGPWMTVVSREVEFDEGAVPDIRLPAVAGIFRLEDPDVLGPRVTAAFQTLISVSNIERAQQAQDPMILSLVAENGVSVTRAHFLAPPEGEGVDLRYNLEPSCARVGDLFVLGTHETLVRDLVNEIARGEVREQRATHERMDFDGPTVAEFVERNFEALVMSQVLEEGKTYEEAEEDLGGLRMIAGMIERAGVSLAATDASVSLQLDVDLSETTERLR